MAYFNKCEVCGSNLDPGEACECKTLGAQNKRKFEQLTTVTEDGQLKLGGLYEYNKNQNKESFWN
jgi:hypothetical protein